ncbi:putative cyclase dehydrase family protein [Erysiphe necator]|uniref:Putative cyclase dehydrase family protein n=1 Tax=Uncinula necator TaxID=52586 RepID=A0A0B1PHQ5_UNCNE|nr:putative cyclase dehydrase family protein [Erysiphe necator]
MIPVTKIIRSCRSCKFITQTQRDLSFLFGSNNGAQSYSAKRILPYESTRLYELISDIDSYSSFVPFCKHSKVTKQYSPDNDGIRWPAEADLTIGWMTLEESFTSRIYCEPGSVVEALSGEAETSLKNNKLLLRSPNIHSPEKSASVFQFLRTKWTVTPFQKSVTTTTSQEVIQHNNIKDQTQVNLDIEFKFTNPIYASMSESFTPKIVGIMIEAFQKRAYDHLRN